MPWDNKDAVLAAVSNHDWTLQYASDDLKNDKDVVLAAVSRNGVVLNYALEELKKR